MRRTKTPYLRPPKKCHCEFCDRPWDTYAQGRWWEQTSAWAKNVLADLLQRPGVRLLSYGRTRVTLCHKGFVLKVPRNLAGMQANKKEAYMFRKYGKDRVDASNYARCRMWGDILVMERVACAREDGYDSLPTWVRYIDSGQAGYDGKGRMVAYDFG